MNVKGYDPTRVIVGVQRPHRKARRLAAFYTVQEAEAWIVQQEKRDPIGVHRGDYYIDADERKWLETAAGEQA